MKRIALYAKAVNEQHRSDILRLFNLLNNDEYEVYIGASFYELIKDWEESLPSYQVFRSSDDLAKYRIHLFVSIGGDGTFLDGVKYIFGLDIPIVGLNTGRLGFLSRISSEDLDEAFSKIDNGDFGIEKRSVIQLESSNNLFGSHAFALNEMTIHKNDTSSMIIIHSYMNGEFLNSYWADGLIVSTPTGSTAYSMSCGGPIVFPGSNNFIIAPVAPHNLNVRPIVIPDSSKLTFSVEGRSDNFLVSLDSRTEVISSDIELTVSRHSHVIPLILLANNSYLSTLRTKLNWGLDRRN
jgi:NAD+ kinase